MSRARLFFPYRRQGLALIEVLVTVLLTALAFALIYSMSRVQARVWRQQQVMERFLVDVDAFTNVLSNDLASAFAVQGTSPNIFIEVVHLARDTQPGQDEPPFSAEPAAANPPPMADFRGTPWKSTYKFSDDGLVRESRALLPAGSPPFSTLPVLTGVNSAQAIIQGARIEVKITLLSEGRVQTLQRYFFAPGLVQHV